jgi:hypothetical protein
LAGFGARQFGIGSALYIPIGALSCGLVAATFLKETAPQCAMLKVLGGGDKSDARRE